MSEIIQFNCTLAGIKYLRMQKIHRVELDLFEQDRLRIPPLLSGREDIVVKATLEIRDEDQDPAYLARIAVVNKVKEDETLRKCFPDNYTPEQIVLSIESKLGRPISSLSEEELGGVFSIFKSGISNEKIS